MILRTLRRFTTIAFIALLALGGCDDEGSRSDAEQQIAELQGEIASLREQLEDADDAGALDETTIAALEAQLATAEAALTAATSDLATAQSSLATVTTQLDTLDTQLGVLQSLLGSLAGTVELHVPFVVGEAPLVLGQTYSVGANTVSYSQVRYWLSGVELVRQDDSVYSVPESFYLVEARSAETLANGTEEDITLPAARRETVVLRSVPAANYKAVRFHVGVDSTHNDDLSVADGELHVLQNMAFDNGWMWFTSYVFTKTVGSFTPSGGSATAFHWDNGSNADYRTVDLGAFSQVIAVSAQHGFRITAPADLSALVSAVSPQANPTIGASTPATRATLADAFADMFALTSVTELAQ